MVLAVGEVVYASGSAPVTAVGHAYSEDDLEAARAEEIPALLEDADGHAAVSEFCDTLQLTGFSHEVLQQTLEPIEEDQHATGWREGEALGEAWLAAHRACDFPWPFKRDLRHPRASLPGAELVGIVDKGNGEYVLAFGQVKTSKEDRRPPQVVNRGNKSLVNQLLELRDDDQIKKTIVQYLAHRAAKMLNESWVPKFRSALIRYCESGRLQMALFGVLVRDVAHQVQDLAGAVSSLAPGCHALTRIELIGLYLPANAIPEGPQHKPRKKKEGPS